MAGELVTTAEAARLIGVNRATLARWARARYVTPTAVTPGGHSRWDMDELRRQIAAKPPPAES